MSSTACIAVPKRGNQIAVGDSGEVELTSKDLTRIVLIHSARCRKLDHVADFQIVMEMPGVFPVGSVSGREE